MKHIISKFNRLLSFGQKRKIAVLIVLSIIGTIFEVMGVALILPIVSVIMTPDFITTNPIARELCGLLNISSRKTFALICIGILIVVFIVKDAFLIFQIYFQSKFISNSRFAMQRRLLHSFYNRPYEFYINLSSGEALRIIQTDVSQVYALLTALLQAFSEVIVSVAMIITIFVIDWKMTLLVALLMSITIIVILRFINPTMKHAGQDYQKGHARMNKWIMQGIGAIKEIKVYNKENYFEGCYEAEGKQAIVSEQTRNILQGMPRLLIEVVSICTMLSIIGVRILMGVESEQIIPILAAFAMAALKLMPTANRIVTTFSLIAYNLPAIDKVNEYLETYKEPIKQSGGEEEVNCTFTSTLSLEEVSYTYPNSDRKILDNASMTIEKGQAVGIVGTSGEGKTTMVDVLLGILKPQSGRVLVDGVDIEENYAKYLSLVGYIPQEVYMMDDTVRNNVAFGVSEDEVDDAKVWKCLKDAHLDEFVRGLPDGLDAKIGERGICLSGGQCQRIGIARALYADPEILFFDEATSSLDNETEKEIMEAINSLQNDKTIVIIAHRLQTIEKCDIIYRVTEGKVVKE